MVYTVAEAVEGMSSEEAEDKLQQAFGWGPRANKFWRGRKVSNHISLPGLTRLGWS